MGVSVSVAREVVTIDGPAGAGKSTISKRLAARLGWNLLDTGAMFRAVTWAGLNAGGDLTQEVYLATLVNQVQVEWNTEQVIVNGQDVTTAIRTPEVTRWTRYAAASPSVRSALVGWQRDQAARLGRVVTEGRDQGSVVFPDAICKFYLDASPTERAHRRHAEFLAKGEPLDFDTVLAEIVQRDHQDSTRAIAPLRIPTDAVIIDSTHKTVDELVEMMYQHVRKFCPTEL